MSTHATPRRDPAPRRPRRRGRVAPLARVVRYANDRVIAQFRARYDVTAREARALFRETLKLLWLLARKPEAFVLGDMLVLDEMWHAFVLCSEDYERFCVAHLGGMLYHQPTIAGDPPPAGADPVGDLIGLVYDELGPATAERWFRRYAQRYSAANLDARRVSFARQLEARQRRRA